MASDDEAAAPADEASDGATGDGTASDATREDEGFDFRGIMRQLTAPMLESLDSRLREQIEAHVDELLDTKLEDALQHRLATVDRAIADLSRTLEALERRVAAIEGDAPAT
jgi:hypothetical protein